MENQLLINDSGYDEYQLQVEKSDRSSIAVEVLKMANIKHTSNNIFSVIGFIDDAMTQENIQLELHYNLTIWLDEHSVPRRGYRNKIERFLIQSLQLA